MKEDYKATKGHEKKKKSKFLVRIRKYPVLHEDVSHVHQIPHEHTSMYSIACKEERFSLCVEMTVQELVKLHFIPWTSS